MGPNVKKLKVIDQMYNLSNSRGTKSKKKKTLKNKYVLESTFIDTLYNLPKFHKACVGSNHRFTLPVPCTSYGINNVGLLQPNTTSDLFLRY